MFSEFKISNQKAETGSGWIVVVDVKYIRQTIKYGNIDPCFSFSIWLSRRQ